MDKSTQSYLNLAFKNIRIYTDVVVDRIRAPELQLAIPTRDTLAESSRPLDES